MQVAHFGGIFGSPSSRSEFWVSGSARPLRYSKRSAPSPWPTYPSPTRTGWSRSRSWDRPAGGYRSCLPRSEHWARQEAPCARWRVCYRRHGYDAATGAGPFPLLLGLRLRHRGLLRNPGSDPGEGGVSSGRVTEAEGAARGGGRELPGVAKRDFAGHDDVSWVGDLVATQYQGSYEIVGVAPPGLDFPGRRRLLDPPRVTASEHGRGGTAGSRDRDARCWPVTEFLGWAQDIDARRDRQGYTRGAYR